MALVRSIATVGGYTMISRVLGFIRDILIAAILGAGPVADAFFVAFRIPNFFRRLFAEGAFNAAFVPVFSRILTERGRPTAEMFAAEVMTILVTALILLTVAAEVAMPAVVAVFAPGFLDEPEKFGLTVTFTRLTFPYLLFMALTALFSGVLNALYRFAAAAAAPILLNVFLILALLGLARALPTPGHALSWGVAAGGVAQVLLIVAASHRAGVRLHLPRPRLNADVRRMFRLLWPGAVAAGVMQINLLIGTMIASLLPTGSVSYLYYADRVYQLPLGVIGIAIGTALLPLLSRQLRGGGTDEAIATQNRAIEFSMLLTLPATAALMIMPAEIVTVLFQRGAFDADSSRATAAALAAFAAGLPAYVLVKVLAPGFFAREDTVTPLRIAVLSVAANIVLSLILIWYLKHVGIAIATAAASWLNAGLLALVLWRRDDLCPDVRLTRRLVRSALATAIMGAALAFGAFLLAPRFAGGPGDKALALALLVLGGAAVFAAAALALGAAHWGELKGAFRPPPAGDRPAEGPPRPGGPA
jgi:putative peptidoglycan lipid II flippase